MIEKETFGNPNVPKEAKVIGSKRHMSGEIVTTYYVLGGQLFRVDDWVMSEPEKADWEEVNLEGGKGG